MTIQDILTHLQTNAIAYVVVGVCLLPILYIFRRWSVPTILYTLEITIYWSLMHAVMGALVRFAAWFKDQSSMKRAFDTRDFVPPDWTTPWLEPWKLEGYEPRWVAYLEIIFAVLILAAVLRYRPMRIQNQRSRKFDDKGKRLGKTSGGLFGKKTISGGSRSTRGLR
jgi:hypothetical protein